MNSSNIKVGDFVRGWFNKSRFYGVVLEVKKSMVVVDGYRGVGMYDFTTETYPSFTKTGNVLNVRQLATLEKMEIDLLEELGFGGTSGGDEGPEYDSAGFTEEDRIVNGQYRNREN